MAEAGDLEGFFCPITFAVMTDPVMDRDGYTFERTAIVQWLETHHSEPFTRRPMDASELAPNRALRDAIVAYCGKHGKPLKPNPTPSPACDLAHWYQERFNILDADDPHRFRVTMGGPVRGWSLRTSFHAFTAPQPETVRFNVLEAYDPHRFKISPDGEGEGWTMVTCFWAFDRPREGAECFHILQAHSPHRFKVSREGEGEGWSLVTRFYAPLAPP